MSKNKRDPNCTCRKGVMGSYVNCPVHNPRKNYIQEEEAQLPIDKDERNCIELGKITDEEMSKFPLNTEQMKEAINTLFDYGCVVTHQPSGIVGRSIEEVEQKLAAHKTRQGVVNEVKWESVHRLNADGSKTDITDNPELWYPKPPAIDVTEIPNQQAWVFEVLAYCNSIEISPNELIEQHKKMTDLNQNSGPTY